MAQGENPGKGSQECSCQSCLIAMDPHDAHCTNIAAWFAFTLVSVCGMQITFGCAAKLNHAHGCKADNM